MKQTSLFPSVSRFVTLTLIFISVAVIATQSTVTLMTAHAQAVALDKETQSVVTKVTTELNRRSAAIESASAGVARSKTLTDSQKNQLKATLDEVNSTNNGLLTKIKGVKNAAEAQLVALEVDAAYEKYQTAVGQSSLLEDSDAQSAVKQQLETTAANIQSLIDEKGAEGQDVSSEQKQMKGLDQLIETIAAIIQSIIALLLSLVAGDIGQAASIFKSILGQLGLNMESFLTVEGALSDLVGSLTGGISFGASGS